MQDTSPCRRHNDAFDGELNRNGDQVRSGIFITWIG